MSDGLPDKEERVVKKTQEEVSTYERICISVLSSMEQRRWSDVRNRRDKTNEKEFAGRAEPAQKGFRNVRQKSERGTMRQYDKLGSYPAHVDVRDGGKGVRW